MNPSAALGVAWLLLLPLAAPGPASGQSPPDETLKVWINLKDKGPGGSGMDGASRDYENLPLHQPYLAALASAGAKVGVALKWQNRVSAHVPRARLAALESLPFVAGISIFPRKAPAAVMPPSRPWQVPGRPLGKAAEGSTADGLEAEGFDYGAAKVAVESLEVSRVHRWMAGRGMSPGLKVRVAVIDADFDMGHRVFQHLFDQGRIKDQWDFVEGGPTSVTRDFGNSHGAQCLSFIAADLPGTLVGVAPAADFLLYRAEDVSQERYIEEDFVAAAIERAVDSGAKVISISLGYRDSFTDGSADYPYAWLDGRTRPSSLAALGAARRDVLVVAAVGNTDPGEPHPTPTLGAPADADSILAVGIVGTDRIRCGYSCTGPAADGRIKPDIAAMGVAPGCALFAANTSQDGEIMSGTGTSYATPLIAGIAALIRQARPDLDAEAVRQAILSSGHRAGRPDSEIGYGLADAWAALKGPGAAPPPYRGRMARVYHPGGTAPLSLAWVTGEGAREVLVTDARGRRIEVTQRNSGARLLLDPGRDLRTGVYLVRARPQSAP